jgi:hypothetical protein
MDREFHMISCPSFWEDCPSKKKTGSAITPGNPKFVNLFERRSLKKASLFLPQTLDITY